MVIWLIFGLGALSLLVAFMYSRMVTSVSIEKGAESPQEVAKLTEISEAIAEGAMAFF